MWKGKKNFNFDTRTYDHKRTIEVDSRLVSNVSSSPLGGHCDDSGLSGYHLPALHETFSPRYSIESVIYLLDMEKGMFSQWASLAWNGLSTLGAKNPFALMGLFGLQLIALTITYVVSSLGSSFRSIRVLFRLLYTPETGVYGARTSVCCAYGRESSLGNCFMLAPELTRSYCISSHFNCLWLDIAYVNGTQHGVRRVYNMKMVCCVL